MTAPKQRYWSLERQRWIYDDDEALNLARRFHEAYERLAPDFGYTTKPETREFDEDTPNGRLMIAVCAEILAKEQP